MSEWDAFPPVKSQSEWDAFPAANKRPLAWGDVGSQALSNAGSSAKKLVTDTIEPFLSPIETAKNIGRLGMGTVQKFTGGGEYTPYADAVGAALKDRYGGMENIKRTIAADPVGVMADVGSVLTGGGALLRQLPKAGGIANVVSKVVNVVDPFSIAGKGIEVAGNAGSKILGVTTGAGSMPVKAAFDAGVDGGQAGQAFRENMRGQVPMENVISQAKGAVGNLRNERGAEYRAGMAPIAADTKVLDFADIDSAIGRANTIKNYKGQDLSPKTADVRQELGSIISDWKNLNPADFHTAGGLDALKQKVGDVMDALPYNTPQRTAAEGVYNSIKDTIKKQAPEYEKTMRKYELASSSIRDTERTLSLGKNATTDTALRKLQSVTRDNVNTNYGKRADMARQLERAGAPNLMESLAGQGMQSWTPRGLGQITATGAGIGGALFNPQVLAALPAMSPRVVGEAAHLSGRVAAPIMSVPGKRNALIAALYGGRLNNNQENPIVRALMGAQEQ